MSRDIKLNLDLKDIKSKLAPALGTLRKYAVLIFIVSLALIYGFFVFRINSLNTHEPSEDEVTEQLLTVKRPKIDQSAIDKIQQLQDNSVEVQSLFKHARDNPFQE